MVRYTTAAKEADAEQIIEKSRFIAHVKPVYSKEEADIFIASVRKKYKDASHNVPAFVIGEKQQLQWASDDGEPQGTSGAPIVQMLVSEGLSNICIVVTRYFGGIKLGTGGLVRAYTSSAKLALEASGLHSFRECRIKTIKIGYSYLSKIKSLQKNGLYDITSIAFSDQVLVTMAYEPEVEADITALLSDVLQGSPDVVEQKESLV